MEQDPLFDEHLILRVLPQHTLRMLNKSLRKLSFRDYVRYVLEQDWEEHQTSQLIYFMEQIGSGKHMAFIFDAIYTSTEFFAFEEDGDYSVEHTTHLIGSSNEEKVFNCSTNLIVVTIPQRFTRKRVESIDIYQYIDIDMTKVAQSQDGLLYFSLDYKSQYDMLCSRPKYSDLIVENEDIFRQEVKRIVLQHFGSTISLNVTYLDYCLWLYCNCIAIGVTFDSDYENLYKDLSEEKVNIQEYIDYMYDILLEELNTLL